MPLALRLSDKLGSASVVGNWSGIAKDPLLLLKRRGFLPLLQLTMAKRVGAG